MQVDAPAVAMQYTAYLLGVRGLRPTARLLWWTTGVAGESNPLGHGDGTDGAMAAPRRDVRERGLLNAYGQLGDANEVGGTTSA